MNFIQSTTAFNGHLCFIGQFAPFNKNHLEIAIAGLKFIEDKYDLKSKLKYNFFLGSSQYTNFKTLDFSYHLPFEIRYEIMVSNVVEISKQYSFTPTGLYHISDYDFDQEWVKAILTKIGKGSIIITTKDSGIYEKLKSFTNGDFGYLIFNHEDYKEHANTNEIRKLLVNGNAEDAKQYLPDKTIEVMSKYGLLN